jgi:hypothetical protein
VVEVSRVLSIKPQRLSAQFRSRLGGSAHSPLYLLLRLFARPPVASLQESDEFLGVSFDEV